MLNCRRLLFDDCVQLDIKKVDKDIQSMFTKLEKLLQRCEIAMAHHLCLAPTKGQQLRMRVTEGSLPFFKARHDGGRKGRNLVMKQIRIPAVLEREPRMTTILNARLIRTLLNLASSLPTCSTTQLFSVGRQQQQRAGSPCQLPRYSKPQLATTE